MPGDLSKAVTIRRRSAAHGCANAHSDLRSTGVVGTIKSMLTSGKIWWLKGDYRDNNRAQNVLIYTSLSSGNSPVKWG